MTEVLTATLTDPVRRTASHPARRDILAPLAIGLFAWLVSFAWSWQPSYWGDEAASVMSAERSVPELFRLLGHIDAVHGAYYLFLHFWIDLFGASELATRLPSALAIGVAAAGTVILTRMLMDARVALVAGAVFAVLPRVTYMGAEARSTAGATMLAVWVMVLLVYLLQRPSAHSRIRGMLWGVFAVGLAAGFYTFLYLVLLIPVQALLVILLTLRSPDRRSAVRSWLIATGAAVTVAAPVFFWGVQQREQISFLARRPQVDVLTAAVNQWFLGVPLAVVAWLLILIGVAAVLARRRHRTPEVTTGTVSLTLALSWMLVPTAILLAGTHLVAPMYSLRYLSICTPAVAIAMSIGIVALRHRWLRLLAMALVAFTLLPTYAYQRGDFAKNDGSDWRQTADVLAAQALPGDAVVFDESVLPSRKPRLALHLYPDAFRGLIDVTLGQPYQLTDSLWDTTVPLTDRQSSLGAVSRIWLLQDATGAPLSQGADVALLAHQGFSVEQTILVNRTTIIEMTR
ncbi:glycosyltransferase family 39 protein [Cryobacterium sp. MLB-32]|uniref:glycosyltransferase family 39 protein n=1 Tax=Cryobacterium sp. MLB-32 TaxID=1529318 RepID=UPI00068C5F5B|nr:glycosyltransferase family 39 protein [Cryobacterium sp. MLB-32]